MQHHHNDHHSPNLHHHYLLSLLRFLSFSGGLPVIRSFHKQSMFQRVNEVTLDDNLSTYNTLKFVDRWLSFRLEVLGNFIVLFASGLAVLSSSQAGSTGLSLNNALGITGLLNWAVRNAAEAESYMNSVERVYHTIEQTPQERSRVVDSYDPSAFIFSSTSTTTMAISADDDDDKHSYRDSNSGCDVSDDHVIISEAVDSIKHIDDVYSNDDVSVGGVDTPLVNAHHYNAEDISINLQLDSSPVSSCIEDSLLSSTFDVVDAKDYNSHTSLKSDDSISINTVSSSSSVASALSSVVHFHPKNDSDLISSGWPYSGGIVMEDVKLRYRQDFSLVLRGISVAVSPGERIGIVGE
jgi:ABC-type multidrug transport system fused ATPase/permease subunit